jgi:DNA modification methylase
MAELKCFRCEKWPCECPDGVTLIHGDCREVLPQLEPVDLVLTDPPYSVSGFGVHQNVPGKGSRTMDFFPGDDDWPAMTAKVAASIDLSLGLQPTTVIAFCGHRQFGKLLDVLEARGYSTRPFVWGKACPIPAPPGAGFDSAIELAIYAYVTGRTWNPRPGEKAPNLLIFDSYRHGQPGKVNHPTQKPLNLIKQLLAWCSSAGDRACDPFAGSCTTLVAAKQLGRRAVGIEVNEDYCRIGAARLRQEVFSFTE